MIANPIRLVLSMWILCFSVGAAHSEDGLAKGRRNGVELPACAVRRLGASRFVHPGEITAVTFVGDGARVASASGNAIYIWESATGNHCATLTGHKDVIRKIDSSHDGSLLASLSKGGRVILWDLKKKEQRFHIDETAKRALLCFSPDGKYLALAGHTVKLINPQTGKLTCTLGPGKRFKDGVRSLAFSPDGKLLAIADESDGSLSYWEVDQAKKIAGSEDIGGDRMIFTRDGKTLIAFWRGTPFFLNPRTGKLIAGLGFAQVGDGYCDVIALMPDGKHFFAAGSSFGIFRFKIKKSDSPLGKEVEVRRVRRFDEDRQYRDVTACAVNRKCTMVADADGRFLRLWDIATGKRIRPPGHDGHVNDISFSADGKIAASAGGDRVVFWDIKTGRQFGMLQFPSKLDDRDVVVWGAQLTPDGKSVFTTASYGVFDVKPGNQTVQFRDDDYVPMFPGAVAISPNGKFHVWNASLGSEDGGQFFADELPGGGFDAIVEGASFAPDSKTVALACGDQKLYLFDTSFKPQKPKEVRLTWKIADKNEVPDLILNNVRLKVNGAKVSNAPLVFNINGINRKNPVKLQLGNVTPIDVEIRADRIEKADDLLIWVAPRKCGTPKLVTSSGGRLHKVVFSPDGRYLFCYEVRTVNDRLPGFISVWDIVAQKWVRHWQVHESSGEFPARFSPDRCPKCRFVPLAISPDGALVATASGNNVVLWEAATGKERRRLTDRDVVCALAFAPDGTLASGSCDSTILLWNPYQHTGDRPGSDRFAELWQVLADEDAGKAFAAMCALAAAGPKAADFLYARLKPTAEQVAQGKRIQSLVEALDDPSFAKREAAQQQLAKCGRQAEGALRAALRNSKSNELTKRGRELLATITSQPRSASERRRLRAVEALAHAHADSYLQKLARTKTAVGYEAAIYCHLREKTMGNRP